MVIHRTLIVAVMAFVPVLTGATVTPESAPTSGGQLEALEYGFNFASALDSVPKDQTRAQAGIVEEYILANRLEQAVAVADRVSGWKQGTAYADLAAEFAKQGDRETARALIVKATEVGRQATGWYGPRIRAHVARALAIVGDLEASRDLSSTLAEVDRPQYLARSAAAVAIGHAVRGDFDAAIAQLEPLDETNNYEDAWWRTGGYIDIARQPQLDQRERLGALERAWNSAHGVPGWRPAEALYVVAEVYEEIGENALAAKALREAEQLVAGLADDHVAKAPILCQIATIWSRLGEKAHARELLAGAERVTQGERVGVVEKPRLLAMLAMAYQASGDVDSAKRWFDEALSLTEQLVNARPRVLAAVDICRAMAREDFRIDATTRKRLDDLYTGLKPPW